MLTSIMSTNEKDLYKVYKYAIKSKNKLLLDHLSPTNMKTIYMHEKICYLNGQNQHGGVLVDPEKLKDIDIIQVSYHGSLKTNMFIIPDNIYLIIPLCCGFYNYADYSYDNFFMTQNDERGNHIDYPLVNDRIK